MFQLTTHQGIRVEDGNATYYTNASITGFVNVGMPVSLDASQNLTIGLAADGAQILGALESFENRSQEGYNVGAVAPLLYTRFEYDGVAPKIGEWVVGAGAGKVKASASFGRCMVEGIDTANKTVQVTFL